MDVGPPDDSAKYRRQMLAGWLGDSGRIPRNVWAALLFLLTSFIGDCTMLVQSFAGMLIPYAAFSLLVAGGLLVGMVRQQWWAWQVLMLISCCGVVTVLLIFAQLHYPALLLPLVTFGAQIVLLLTDKP